VKTLDLKLGRELRQSGALLLAIGTIIAVGVTCFVSMGANYRNLLHAQQNYYSVCRMADFWIELRKAPLTEAAALERIPGVAAIRPRIQANVTVDLERVPRPLNGLALSLPERQQPVINDIVLKRGSYFTEWRQEEVIVNDAFARQHDLHPGSRLHLIINNRRQDLFVVGTASSSEFVYLVGPGSLIPDPEHFGVFYLQQHFMEELFEYEGACNQIVGMLSPEVREHPERILKQAEQLLAPYGVLTTFAREDQSSDRFLSSEIDGQAAFSLMMPAIFLAVAALILNVLIIRFIEQQRTLVGTLKAVGYADHEILWHYLKFGLAVGFSGGVMGCFGGYGLAEMSMVVYKEVFDFPQLDNAHYWELYLEGICISLACAALGALQGVRQVLRLEPAEAMRPKPPPQGGAILLERWSWFWDRLSIGWRTSLRNVWRNRVRTLAGAFAAAMGTSLMMTSLMGNSALKYLIEFQFEKIQRSDLELTFKDERGREVLEEVLKFPAVERAEPVFNVACTFMNGSHEKRAAIMGLARNARLTTMRDTSGRIVPMPEAGLVMGDALARMLHVRAGDWIVVRPVRGGKRDLAVRVVQVTEGFLGLSCYAEIEFLNRLIGEEFSLNAVQLQLDPRPEQRAALYPVLKRCPALQAYSDRGEVIESMNETLLKLNGFAVGILISFAGVIFFGSTLNSALIGLAERQREVATLLVLGYDPWTVGAMFLREMALVNLVGILCGLPIGYGLTYLAAWAFETELARLPIVAPLWIYAACIGIGLGFSFAAHLFVQRQISRMDWLDVMKTQE